MARCCFTGTWLALHLRRLGGVLFNKNTFSRVEARGVFVGQVHGYTDWALRDFCAQAWFRRASSGKRTDVQAQERGHQHLPCGWQAIMGKCPFP